MLHDEIATRTLLGPTDPARDYAVPAPKSSVSALIDIAEHESRQPVRPLAVRRPMVLGRRTALAGAVTVVLAGAMATVHSFAVPMAKSPAPPGSGVPGGTGPEQVGEVRLGPLIVPVAVQYPHNPPAARDELHALADKLSPARYDNTSGRYTYIRTSGWNTVIDASPDGRIQMIRPQDKQIWYLADGSGRITTKQLPPAYPNEESRRYWEQQAPAPSPTPHTSAQSDHTADLPAGQIGPQEPLPPDPARLAAMLGVDQIAEHGPGMVFTSVRDVYATRLVPQQTRAQILRILADLDGISWRGTTKDRAGRPGVAISIDGTNAEQLLIFDPRTGTLLAWDEVERPTDTVAGALLILDQRRTDELD